MHDRLTRPPCDVCPRRQGGTGPGSARRAPLRRWWRPVLLQFVRNEAGPGRRGERPGRIGLAAEGLSVGACDVPANFAAHWSSSSEA